MVDLTNIVDDFLKWQEINLKRTQHYFDFITESHLSRQHISMLELKYAKQIMDIGREKNLYRVYDYSFAFSPIHYVKRYNSAFYFYRNLWFSDEGDYAVFLLNE